MSKEGTIEKGVKQGLGFAIALFIILVLSCGGCVICAGVGTGIQESRQEQENLK